jgi:hypothetical protein
VTKRHPILSHVRSRRGSEIETLDAWLDEAAHEAWSHLRSMARGYAHLVDAEALEVAVRRRGESPPAFFALLLDIAFKDPARRAAMLDLFRAHLPEHPGPALGAAGYNLHEYHALLDRGWIALARERFDASPEGAWGIVEAAAMYERHCLTPEDVDWFEARRAGARRDYFVTMLSLAAGWDDRRADLLARAIRHVAEQPADAVDAAALAAKDEVGLLTPGLIAAMLAHLPANAERGWEFFEGACRAKHEIFDDPLLDGLEAHAPGRIFSILRHLIDTQPSRTAALLDRYGRLLRRHPREGIDSARYAFQRDDIRLLRPDLVAAVCDGFEAAPYEAYELLWHCVEDRPELVGPPEVEAALRAIPHATNRAFGFFRELLKRRPEFTRESTLALFECLAQEPAHRAFNRAEEMASIIAVSEAAHVQTGLERALREPPRVGSRRARALMAILFRQKLRARRHVLLEALRYAGGIVLWHNVGGESEKFSPVWDFLFFIIDNAADDAISTSAAEKFLEGAFQLHYLCRTMAEHEEFLRKLDTEDTPPRAFPAGAEFLGADSELARLHRIVGSLAGRLGSQTRCAPLDDFLDRFEAAEREREAVAKKGVKARLEALDRLIACRREPDYRAAFTDPAAEARLSEEAQSLVRREKKDLAKKVRDALRAEAVRIAVSAVEHSRLELYRGRLRDVLGRDVDIATVEPRILPSFLWFAAIQGFPNNRKHLKRLIEDRIAGRPHDWLRTEPPAAEWADRVRKATPGVKLEHWRAPFSREFVYRPKDANAEKRRRIRADLAQARAILERLGAKPASDAYDELAARFVELRAGVEEKPGEDAPPPRAIDRAALEEVAMNLERVRLMEQTPESDFEGRIVLTVETDPFEILFMGEYGFASCLSLRGSNAWSAVSNAIDIDKAIVWAKEGGGNVVGRRLLALLPEGVVQFRTYANRHGLALDPFFDEFVEAYAAHCGTRTVRGGHPKPLLSDRWYDDGAI